MDFAEILKRVDRDLYDATDKAALPQIARFMERSGGLAGLLKSGNAVLASVPVASILRLSDSYAHYVRWKGAYRNTKRVLATSKLALPDKSLQGTAFPHELAALERTAKMCPRAGYPDLDSWQEAVDAHLALWNACVNMAENTGVVSAKVNGDHPEAAEFEAYGFTKEKLSEIKNYTWLGARRGEKAGAIELTFSLPMEEVEKQASAYLPKLGLAAQQREVGSVVEELVGNNLESALSARLDYRSMEAALTTARNAYSGLLSTPPLKAKTIVGTYVGASSAPAAVVLVDGAGKLQDSKELAAGDDIAAALSAMVTENEAEAVVLPVSAPDAERLRAADDGTADMEGVDVVRILPAAISDVRGKLELPVPVASALILVHRAIRPLTEWGNVPAAKLGISEFSSEIPAEKLEEALTETRMFLRYKAKRGDGAARSASAGGRNKKRLNPMVKTIRDLKAGMTVDGVVTNLTKFGAFINVGLTTEAMIHVSQLSVEFVEEPSQVVSVGQTVNARVLEVIPEKGRIALSLKPEGMEGVRTQQESKELQAANDRAESLFASPAAETDGETPADGAPAPAPEPVKSNTPRLDDIDGRSRPRAQRPRPGQDQPKLSRGEALAGLDALFKK